MISLTHIVVADLLAGQKMEQGCCTADTESNLSHVSCSHLSSLVLKPHLHHPNAESRLGGQRLPHLKPWRQKDFQHPSPQENKALSGTLEYFGSLTYLPHFPIGTLPLWFALIWVNVEWMPWSFFFWTSWLLPLQSLGPGAAPVFRVRATEAALLQLSMTFGAGGPRYTSLPRLTQNRKLLATSKLSSEVGGFF